MPLRKIILLASSKKLGGSCVAGIDRDSREWVRLVPLNPDEGLREHKMLFADGSSPKLLDVIEVECEPHPRPDYQSENLLVTDRPWVRVARPEAPDQLLRLNSIVETGSSLFGFGKDYCDLETVQRYQTSLCMVSPTDINWIVTRSHTTGRRQIRTRFALKDESYNLAVTDHAIEDLLAEYDDGEFSESDVGIQDRVGYHWSSTSERLVFVASLGRPFGANSRCHKIIAGVTTIPFQPEAQDLGAAARILKALKAGADIAVALAAGDLEFIDKRPSGGCLWVKSGGPVDEIIRELSPLGYKFVWAPNGGKATQREPAWFIPA